MLLRFQGVQIARTRSPLQDFGRLYGCGNQNPLLVSDRSPGFDGHSDACICDKFFYKGTVKRSLCRQKCKRLLKKPAVNIEFQILGTLRRCLRGDPNLLDMTCRP